MKIFDLDMVPLNVPLKRRLQTLAVIIFYFTFLQGFTFIGLSTFFLLFTPFFFIPLAYLVWYFYDFNRSEQGGRTFKFIRNLKIWDYYNQYFPIHLIKTTELDPSRNYLLCVSPHGILCFGIFGCFSTEAAKFSEKFPNIKPHPLTLNINFRLPFHRELIMSNGSCSASERSIKYILNNKGTCKEKGQAAILVVGGAAESLEVKEGTNRLVLKNRKGFVRVALQTGTPLVPVFSFGENDSFKTIVPPNDSKLKKFQNTMKNLLTFAFPIFYGRGIFNYTFGLLPFRRPIYMVVGKPIELPKIENPTKEEITAYHDIYIKELVNLFDEHKEKYLSDKNSVLEII